MIDKATVDLIIDSADIVDVVSDFVTLRKRGANYVGLCPFHNDRTPSFYVSKAKGLCKCFACGEGGSSVGFIMKHEQLSYHDALLYLANKYHIEVKEREQTDEERAEQIARDAMIMLNEWACKFFEDQLHNTTEGNEIGLSYFNQRGFSVEIMQKFRLGYSPESRSALYNAAISQGFNRQLLFDTGLCIDDNRGGGYDRYRGRVIFPIFNVAGKIVAFGGRTLKNDPAKYVNSPESIIYNKSKELYGLFQAKREITRSNKCFIVEGYADVISMHQSGFTNVIASSGTALTDGHIKKIHQFTENVTEMFDGDAAGIKAALKGIDKLLSQGLNIKVLLLPDNDDPDSYSRKHSASEIQEYIDKHEEDFIEFKSNILLKDARRDPIKRSQAIEDVVKSIAVIPSEITRAIYAKECSDIFNIGEDVVIRDINKYILQNREEQAKQAERDRLRQERRADADTTTPEGSEPLPDDSNVPEAPVAHTTPAATNTVKVHNSDVYPQEETIIKYIVKYGMSNFCISYNEQQPDLSQYATVIEYIYGELNLDNITFSTPAFAKIFNESLQYLQGFYTDLQAYGEKVASESEAMKQELMSKIDPIGLSNDDFTKEEERIKGVVSADTMSKMVTFRTHYLEKILCSHQDDDIRQVSSDLASEPYTLSKIHTEYATIATELDRLQTLVPEAINNWKNALVVRRINEVQMEIQTAPSDKAEELMIELQQLYATRSQLSKLIGDRVVNPK